MEFPSFNRSVRFAIGIEAINSVVLGLLSPAPPLQQVCVMGPT